MKIGVVILTKNNFDILKKCLDSFINNNSYKDLVFYIGDTGSDKEVYDKIVDYLELFPYKRELVKFNYYNFAKNNNWIIKNRMGDDIDLILFCNDDIELINDPIVKMVENVGDGVGTVGCKLLYPNGKIQHGGHIYIKSPIYENMYDVSHRYLHDNNRVLPTDNVVGNTFAFCLTSKLNFDNLGGLSEKYSKCFEDVDYCIECTKVKLSHIFVGEAECLHHESYTRRKDVGGGYINSFDVDRIRKKILEILL